MSQPSFSDEGRGSHRQKIKGFAGVPITASDVMVYDAKTGELLRIEDKEGRIVLLLLPKQAN